MGGVRRTEGTDNGHNNGQNREIVEPKIPGIWERVFSGKLISQQYFRQYLIQLINIKMIFLRFFTYFIQQNTAI